ncbi:MAG: septum formation initiator family protein [bacterium]|nr:septum formation initiator family protein [bacterium]
MTNKSRNKKNFIYKFFFSQKFLAFLGLIIIILISFPLAKNISNRYRINNEIKELEKEITNLENKNSNFKDLVSYLESNQFVEEQARLKLGLKKEGESVVVIKNGLDNKAENNSTAISSSVFNIPGLAKANLIEPINNLQKWLKYFFGNKK